MKKRSRKGLKVLDKKPSKGGAGGKFHEIKSGKRVKGPKPKRPLPPWRDVRDEIEQ